MPDLFEPLTFARGPAMPNRFALAPLTNWQSHDDGRLGEDEFRWLTYRAEGGFGLVMTCGAHVEARGKGFPGELGAWSDDHIEGLTRLAAGIHVTAPVAICQLMHAGMRAPPGLIDGIQPVCASDNAETGARGLTTDEVGDVVEAFVAGALRAQQAGFDGIEIHGAHGYLLTQFLSAEINHRDDSYGGSVENRARIVHEIVDGIRARCRPDFMLGVRLSPERFGMKLAEIRDLARDLLAGGAMDFLDMSLWNYAKEPTEPEFKGRTLMSYFTELPRGAARLGVTGRIMSAGDVRACLAAGADFVLLGRAAILHHDFPARTAADPEFRALALPVSADYLRGERLAPRFLDYLKEWPGFVTEELAAAEPG